ncbi:MAG: 30S ribosomal protein S16 [Candidatus Caldipriscus sp.]|jgi:small subunit ribosomal protein S16
MVKIRLQRVGKKNDPRYRIVVADSRAPRDGKVIEVIGHLNPKDDNDWSLDYERYEYWISKGAQPTERVLSVVRRLEKKEVKHGAQGSS